MPDLGKQKILLDTYAWIEYFKGSAEGAKARKFVESDFELFTPSIVIAELSDKYHREGVAEWPLRKGFIELKTRVLVLDERTADEAGRLKQELKKAHRDAGLADAIVLAHSLRSGAKILTGDKHLKDRKNAIDLIH